MFGNPGYKRRKLPASKLGALIRMNDKPRCRLFLAKALEKRIHCKPFRHRRCDRPTNNLACKQVQECRKIQITFVRGNIGNVSQPHLVPIVCGKILLQCIRISSIRVVLIVVLVSSSGTFCIQNPSYA